MTKAITIVVKSPVEGVTDAQFEEWVKYQLGYTGGMSIENPLHEHELEALTVSVEN